MGTRVSAGQEGVSGEEITYCSKLMHPIKSSVKISGSTHPLKQTLYIQQTNKTHLQPFKNNEKNLC